MTSLLDHLAALVVGGILLGALVLFQTGSRADATEAVEQYRGVARAAELATLLEREIENARGRADTEAAFVLPAGAPGLGPATYRFSLRRARTADGTEYTSQVAFPTLTDPQALSASPVGMVVYHVEDTGETAWVDGRDRALLRATRYTFERGGPLREAGAHEGVLDLDVVALGAGGTEVLEGEFASTPRRLRFALEMAPVSGGSASIKHARTLRAGGAAGGGLAHAPDPSVPGGIPALPGDGAPASGPGTAEPDGAFTICHREPGAPPTTTKVGATDLTSHLSHGDTTGACDSGA